MTDYKTDQEGFWAGEFGNLYMSRNTGADIIASNISLFSEVLSRTGDVGSAIEFGANIGLNLQAIRSLLPAADLSAVEINSKSVDVLNTLGLEQVYHQSILDFEPDRKRDLVLIKGVLIHINPEMLDTVYKALYTSSGRYICVAEYYNPTPMAVRYRGHEERLYKRDFSGEILDRYPDLKLVDYGFRYHRDNNFPMDDITWFLLEKSF